MGPGLVRGGSSATAVPRPFFRPILTCARTNDRGGCGSRLVGKAIRMIIITIIVVY